MESSFSPLPPLSEIRWTDNVRPVPDAEAVNVLNVIATVQRFVDLDRRKRPRVTMQQLAIYVASGMSIYKIAGLTGQPPARLAAMWKTIIWAGITTADLRGLGASASATELPAKVVEMLERAGLRREVAV